MLARASRRQLLGDFLPDAIEVSVNETLNGKPKINNVSSFMLQNSVAAYSDFFFFFPLPLLCKRNSFVTVLKCELML